MEMHSIGIGTIPEDTCFLSSLLEYDCPLVHVKNFGVDMISRPLVGDALSHAKEDTRMQQTRCKLDNVLTDKGGRAEAHHGTGTAFFPR
jgi:hypothetical protein